MNEYRKDLDHGPTDQYYNVALGPLPEKPHWHPLAQPSRTPFPTEEAALRFANARREERPDRAVSVVYPGGGVVVL
ncbi:hypothetical protein SEA_PHARAOH_68 [Mycobacterium phage Pharaoh]|uniref:Uncharacterized protein n=1 Tax=Mycobacterium phage Pharaoh TaxID=2530140 RepID=A0A481W255_9CAUD|nr:hypothetical protein KIV59_gp22 [Mycobacterium phage Pharaoh]QBJ00256.1 hypothetical protein SEA_PHARAOH_68 [Mycobacterium phage Pharaoh]